MDARIGVRRNPKNPDRTEKIFGFDAIIDTSIEIDLGLELPVACTTIAGNGEEGRHFITRPNGFDQKSKRASFSCRRLCVNSTDLQIQKYAENCKHWINYHGFTRHMSISDFPRLIIEVLRGTVRHQKLKALRSASERTNASAKEDLCILGKPKIRGLKNAGVLAQMAVTVLLLKRISRFIVKVTLVIRKMFGSNSQPLKPFLPGPDVPKFIANLIRRE